MIVNRAKNAKRNMIQGFLNKIIMLFCPFIIKTVTVNTLGLEYLGVKSLFTSVFTVLNLSELGIGSAIVYCMYKPIADDDLESIGSLMNLFKKIYRVIGVIIIGFGIIFTPQIPILIKDAVYPSGMNIYIVYFLYLFNTAVSYWMFAYKSALLNAYQRTDVISAISSITNLLCYGLQIVVLIYLRNFYYFLLISIVCNMLNNIITAYNVDHLFPMIKCAGNITKEMKNRLKEKVLGLMIGKLTDASRNTFDNIFISMHLGLNLTAIYSNYYSIISALIGLMTVIYSSLLAGIGNSIQIDSKEKNYRDMIKLDLVYMTVSGWITICIMCLSQPFMTLWMGKDKLLSDITVALLALYYYILQMGNMRALYSDAAGLFWENRNRNILESIANIILNYSLVKIMGINGIVLATILTLLIVGFFGGTHIVFKNYFAKSSVEYLKNHLMYFIINFLICMIMYRICSFIKLQDIQGFFIKAALCITIPIPCYILIYFKTRIFQETTTWLYLKFDFKK